MAKDRDTESRSSSTQQTPGSDPSGFQLPTGNPLSDLMRRAMALGLSGFFTTEEALRRALGDNVPQEWVDFAATQGDRTRKDFAEAVANEIGRALEKVDLAELLGDLLQRHPVEINAKVRLLPPEDGTGPRASLGKFEVKFDEGGES